MNSDDQRKQRQEVLWKCCPVIFQCLDVTTILPYLMSTMLINSSDHDVLRNEMRTRDSKIHYLIGILPRKPDFLKKFLYCLNQTTTGTGHADIASQLTAASSSSYSHMS